jgi:hypothetical protein
MHLIDDTISKEFDLFMSQKRDKGNSQKGKDYAESAGRGKRMISAEEVEKAIHPTKGQNSEQ